MQVFCSLFIGKAVDIRANENSIEVFYHNNRIASHVRRNYSKDPVYLPEHMPENHRKYLEYNTDTSLQWGESIGTSTLIVVKNFLHMHKVEQQGYKPCDSPLKLADRYSIKRLDKACEKALGYTPGPSLKNISTILKNGQDKVPTSKTCQPESGNTYGITRGASYFKEWNFRYILDKTVLKKALLQASFLMCLRFQKLQQFAAVHAGDRTVHFICFFDIKKLQAIF